MKKNLLFSIFILAYFISFSQDLSNKGKDFWVGYGYHESMLDGGNSQNMVLYFATDQVTNVTVSIPGIGYTVTYNNIAANTVFQTPIIPKNSPDARLFTEGISNKGIHITSDKPIIAYAHIYNASVSGATILYPTSTLGKDYYSVNYTNNSNVSNANCWFYVIATDTGTTTIEITPSANTTSGWLAGSTYAVTLTQGQIYNVMGTYSGNNGVDLTGSKIKSVSTISGGCKRIAVFSGSGRIQITCGLGGTSSSDNYMVQSLPKAAWGKKYLTVPSAGYNNDRRGIPFAYNVYRICVISPSTIVKVNGSPLSLASLVNGFYYELPASNEPQLIEADNPVMVAQYFPSRNFCLNPTPGNDGDPEVIYLSPVEQSIETVRWFACNNYNISPEKNYINFVIPNSGTALTSLKLDNNPVSAGSLTVHPYDANYSYGILNVSMGQPHVLQSDSGFNAIAYGYGYAESYGYNAGTNIKDLHTHIETATQFGNESGAVCTGTSLKFIVSFPYKPDSLYWDLSSILNTPQYGLEKLLPMMPADTLVVDSITYINGKALYWYSLTSNYTFSNVGSYTIPITIFALNPDGCGTQDIRNLDLDVSVPPSADFSFTTPQCIAEDVQFTDATITTKPTYIWSWNFGDPGSGALNTSNLKNPSHVFSTTGLHTITFSSITTSGCVASTVSKQINVPTMPTATISGNATVCANSVPSPNIKFTGAGGIAPYTFTYTIDDGTGSGAPQTIGTSVGNSVTLPVPTTTAGTFIYKLVSIKNTGSIVCTNPQTGTVAVTVNPLPTASVSGTTQVCQNATPPNITFTGTNGTAPYTFTYNIDDGTGPGATKTITTISGNSVTVPVPTNIIGQFSYNLLSIADASTTACSQTQSGFATVNVNELPTATISGNSELCINATSPSITFTGAGGKAPYTFTYTIDNGSGPGTPQNINTTSGNSVTLNVPTSVAGNYTYSLVSVKDGSITSCNQAQSGTVLIIIHPQPKAAFTYTAPSCETRTITFDASSSMPNAGTIVSWNWDFGDANATSTNPNTDVVQKPVHTFIAAGTFTVTLTVTTDKGCDSTIAKDITINERPVAGFTIPEVCTSDAFAQFTDTSKISGSGSITGWQWNFGDAANSTFANPNTATVKNAKHKYILPGNYFVTLIAISNTGCRDTIVEPLFVNGANPNANFTILNGTINCANDTILIQNKSNIGMGSITKLEIFWDNVGAPTTIETDEIATPDSIYKHKYPNFNTPLIKTFTIKVRAYSGGTCFDEITKTVTINAIPKVQFNDLLPSCINDNPFVLTQASEVTGASGVGVYSGRGVTSDGAGGYIFNPALAGVGMDTIKYAYTSSAAGCIDSVSKIINVYANPLVDAGADVTILSGGSTTLQPIVTGTALQYLWTWTNGALDGGLNNVHIKNPLASPLQDITYLLTVTGSGGCQASDEVMVKVLQGPKIPNTFTPNNDGINDTWIIKYLDTYPNNRVQVFTRAGQKVFESRGYKTAWNGTLNGKPLPLDTYYYIIEPENGRKPITGYITIIK